MEDTNQVHGDAIQTDIGTILEGNAPKSADSKSASQEFHRESSDAAPDENSRASKDSSWTFRAYESEKKKRQAISAKLKEIEEERDALLFESSQRHEVSPQETQNWLDPLGGISEITIKQNGRVSRAEFIAEHGKQTFAELDRVVGEAVMAGHPDMPLLSKRMRESDDPVGLMAQWATEQLGWSADSAPRQTFPSNLAAARNVGKRTGPAWSGPVPLADIFNRHREKQ